jgi:hypothetical protein
MLLKLLEKHPMDDYEKNVISKLWSKIAEILLA